MPITGSGEGDLGGDEDLGEVSGCGFCQKYIYTQHKGMNNIT